MDFYSLSLHDALPISDIAGYSPSIQGQKKFLYDVMKTVQDVGGPHHKGLGIVYWEPAWLAVKGTSWSSLEGMKYGNDMANTGNHWANQGDRKSTRLNSSHVAS